MLKKEKKEKKEKKKKKKRLLRNIKYQRMAIDKLKIIKISLRK